MRMIYNTCIRVCVCVNMKKKTSYQHPLFLNILFIVILHTYWGLEIPTSFNEVLRCCLFTSLLSTHLGRLSLPRVTSFLSHFWTSSVSEVLIGCWSPIDSDTRIISNRHQLIDDYRHFSTSSFERETPF